jgi:hypothetical protein
MNSCWAPVHTVNCEKIIIIVCTVSQLIFAAIMFRVFLIQDSFAPVVSEKKLEMWKVYRRQTTDDRRQVMAIVHLDLWSRWTKYEKDRVKLHVFGNNSKTVNNIRNLTWVKMISTGRSNYPEIWKKIWLPILELDG